MSAPTGPGGTSPPEPHFMGLPGELREMIYEYLFSELARERNPPPVEFHLCDKTWEITGDGSRLLEKPRTAGLTSILRTCKQVHEEALDSLYDGANVPEVVVCLRPASEPLDLTFAASNLLAHTKKLRLKISMSYPCQSTQHFLDADPPSAATTTRRASWNGEPAVGDIDIFTGRKAPGPFKMIRRHTWAGPAPTRMCFVTYLSRLEALLQSFKYGRNLTRLQLLIEDKEWRLDGQSIDTILRRMDARLRVRKECRLTLRLSGSAQTLVNIPQIADFLYSIQ